MPTRPFLLATLLAVACFALAGQAQEQSADSQSADKPRLKGLLITGGCCHDYPRQAEIITEGLSQRVSIEWEVIHESDQEGTRLDLYKNDEWAKPYDIVVHNECYSSIADEEYIGHVVRGHAEAGVPAIVIHCAMHTFRDAATDEWRKLLGVTSRRHERVKRSLDVKPAAKDHPIMAGFPDLWKTPNGELYIVEKKWPGLTPLATAYSGETKNDETCIWTNEYGKARVFGTTLGHHNETMMADEWLDTTARGLLWAVGKLNDDGSPAQGFAGSGKRPFSFQAKVAAGGKPEEADWSGSVKFPEGEKPVRLFNGRDFSGWEGHTDKYFSIDGKEIVAKNNAENASPVSTYLLTKKKYRNFRLVFEGKLAESKMHSGISLWGEKFETDGEPNSYKGHLVMFPSGWGFYDLYRRKSIYKDDGRAKKADNGDWNRMEILAIGDRIRLAVNGQLVADWTDPMPELCQEGPIGLQLHSNTVPQEVRFRGLILAEDPEDRMITVKE